MYDRIFTPPKQSFFLFGPRGSGKSNLLKKLFPGAHFFNLLMERKFQTYLVNPEQFYNEVQAIEVKATAKVRPQDLKGLQKKILVYTGKERQRLKNDIEVMPVSDFCNFLHKLNRK